MQFIAPIPGQSLTDEPKKFAWERPPEFVDPDDAVVYHLDRLSDRQVMDATLFLLQYGYPVDLLTRSLLTGAVGEGIHSIDVSLIITPVIEEELRYMARTAGIEYKDTFTDDKTDDDLQEERLKSLVLKRLEETREEGLDKAVVEETVEALGSPEEAELEEMQENITPEQEQQQQELMDEGVDINPEAPTPSAPSGSGLMSRGM